MPLIVTLLMLSAFTFMFRVPLVKVTFSIIVLLVMALEYLRSSWLCRGSSLFPERTLRRCQQPKPTRLPPKQPSFS